MFFLLILIFMPFFTAAMNQPSNMISSTEKSFLRNVLKVTQTDQFHLIKKNSFRTEDEEKKIEQLEEQKERYEQFLRWRQLPRATQLKDAKFLFSKMAAENNIEGLISIRDLTVEWKLITDEHELLGKLGYDEALADAVKSGCGQTTAHLLGQKGMPTTQFYDLLKQICTREWGSHWKTSTLQQFNIAQLMIQKSTFEKIEHLLALIRSAESNKASERVIKCLYHKLNNHPEYSNYSLYRSAIYMW